MATASVDTNSISDLSLRLGAAEAALARVTEERDRIRPQLTVYKSDFWECVETLIEIWTEEHTDPATAARDTLRKISMSIDCPFCEGLKTVRCHACGGLSGPERPCMTCGGSGEVPCRACDGEGHV